MSLTLITLFFLHLHLVSLIIFLLFALVLELDLHVGSIFLGRDLSFLEKVILDPKCKSIHDNRNHYYDDYQLEGRICFNPAQQKFRYSVQEGAQHIFEYKKQYFGYNNYAIPNEELKEPSFIINSMFNYIYSIMGGASSCFSST